MAKGGKRGAREQGARGRSKEHRARRKMVFTMAKSQLHKWSLLWQKSEYENGIYYGKKAPTYIFDSNG